MKKVRPIKLVIWRHGQTDWNVEGKFQGHTDIPLNPTGEYQVKHAARILSTLKPTQIISSDLIRAKQTALALASITELPLKTYAALRETNGGKWEGKQDFVNRETDAINWARWVAGENIKAGEYGESRSEVAHRVRNLLDPMIENLANVETEEEAVLVIATHGGTARAIIGSYLELPVSKWTTLGGLSNASWSVLEPRKFPKILETDPKVDLTVFHRNQWQLVEHNALTIPEPVIGDDDAE